MSSIRARLSLIVLLVLTGMAWFGQEAVRAYREFDRAKDKITDVLELRAQVLFLDTNSHSRKLADKLKARRQDLGPDPRSEHLSDIIQAYNEKDAKHLRRRVLRFIDSERQIMNEAMRAQKEAEFRFKQNAAITLLLPLLGLLVTWSYTRVKVLRGIDRMSRRMMDFLVDRYSFQFSEPEGNELGMLQRTFNSLAQRVINNMDELKSLDQAKSDFLSITSHELRTPMTSIKGSLSLLTSGVMGKLDPQSEKLLKIAENETDRLIRLINDLLDLAKIEAGKLPLKGEWVVWDDLLHKTAQSLVGLANAAHVSIAVQPMPGLEVYMDKDRMQQILTNLLSNSIKFSPPDGTVSLLTSKTRNFELLVQVRDQGIGIAPGDQELIFQKFRQGASAENPIVKGTGLGLAIARALVEEHGGTIGVHSEKNKGATFYFTLPRWRDQSGQSPHADDGPLGGQRGAA
ncbi:MAG: cell wall metabolism sensor histidine kinase WalK [Bdellovibrionaceae bacterium]|nr:cell wall metabolism sensor histidine kinase WalK [Pseudobdellovibrionaceae bacterium]